MIDHMPGTNLARLRKQAGLSQSQLAAASSTHKQQIAKVEMGQRSIGGVSLRIAVTWANILGVHAEDLLDAEP